MKPHSILRRVFCRLADLKGGIFGGFNRYLIVQNQFDPQMIEVCQTKAKDSGLTNISCQQRDFVTYGTCLPDRSADFVMLFNILHAENPNSWLEEAYRILVPVGKVGIIHWNYDPTTPRGPSMDIRPYPEQCQEWVQSAGFHLIQSFIQLPPYHYGIVGQK